MISVSANLPPEKFLKLAGPWLNEKEAQNNLILGIAENLVSKPLDQRQEHHFWAVKRDGAVAGAAFWTPPYKLGLSEMEPEALITLARKVKKTFPDIPGANGPKDILPTFIRAWNTPGLQAVLETSYRLYSLEKVEPVPEVAGALKEASPEETELLTHWCHQFRQEIRAPEQIDEKALMEGYLREKRIFTWEEGGGTRAMAGYAGSTSNGVRINMVYTPQGLRKRGYASNLVAALSQRLLSSGKKFCVLYADLLNPTSNSIYQKMGYHPVCDWDGYSFQKFERLF
jgi:predicted GNAT family acetyltransferase